MARRAVILHEGSPGPRELRLGRILDFFGVPWKLAEAGGLNHIGGIDSEYAVFGSIQVVAKVLERGYAASSLVTFYAYLDDERSLCVSALQSLFKDTQLSLQDPPIGKLPVRVSDELDDVAGPMAGISFPLQLASEDTVLTGASANGASTFSTIISAGNAPLFLQLQHNGASVFFCASSQMVDIDQTVGRGFYDIKDHFCSAVSLVMFIKFALRSVTWRPQELGACLIIDDPLLKLNYGFCNFSKLRDLMGEYGFTTNIAFIPWNWRRTSSAAGKFFSHQSGLFSVSIHGCDHTGGEFASTSPEFLQGRAQMARSRMQSHELRTGIRHDPVMVFPQGAFSSACPEVLKRNGFLAAVNTEIAPIDAQNVGTRIKDVWDVAIMTYGDFPIFTRRYPFHGLENFAFDLLLGKPCLIVTHHEFFKDGCAALVELIRKIGSLNCRIHWRPLGEVIRRACRRRYTGVGTEELEMYGNELRVDNPSDQAIELTVRKRKSQDDIDFEILCDEKPVAYVTEPRHFAFHQRIAPHSETYFQVAYRGQASLSPQRSSLRFELGVAARRILSEFRDEYLSTNRFLSVPADRIRNIFGKAG